MFRPRRFLVAVSLLAAACTTEPKSAAPPSLLVTNATCDGGACAPLEVGVWPSKFALPCPVGGCHVLLATVTSASACVPIPRSLSLKAIREDSLGYYDTTIVATWTPTEWLELTAWGLQGAAQLDTSFVPASSSGWSLSLPGGPLAPSKPCGS